MSGLYTGPSAQILAENLSKNKLIEQIEQFQSMHIVLIC